jgi:hypothetical protein
MQEGKKYRHSDGSKQLSWGHRETLVGRSTDTNGARLDYMEDTAFSWSTNIGTAQHESLECLEKPLKEVIRLFQWCQRQGALRRGPVEPREMEDVAGSHSARLRNQDNCRNQMSLSFSGV